MIRKLQRWMISAEGRYIVDAFLPVTILADIFLAAYVYFVRSF